MANKKPQPAKAKTSATKSIKLNDLSKVTHIGQLSKILNKKGDIGRDIVKEIAYQGELENLQEELVKLQNWVVALGARVAILFEGRDAAGKSGAIRRFVETLNPRHARIAALPKPTEAEQGQWFFQRYVKQLPDKGEIVFFDRSWYNRAVVEPVMGFCTEEQYELFMRQVTPFENMLIDDGIIIIKFWFSISKAEQKERFLARSNDLVKRWKLSPVDKDSQKKWDKYTEYLNKMIAATNHLHSPWIVVKANSKKKARLESIKYVLSTVPYTGKEKNKPLTMDPETISVNNNLTQLLDI